MTTAPTPLKRRPPTIVVSGPFPPPVHGLAVVNQYLADALAAHADVVRLDCAGPMWRGRRLRAAGLRAAWALGRLARLSLVCVTRRRLAVCIGLSAGWAQAYDLAVMAIALATRHAVFVHHHSFGYLRQPGWPWRLGAALLRRSRHVVLCAGMGDALQGQLGLANDHVLELSNACWVTPAATPGEPALHTGGALRLGFIANIRAEKGIFEFFDLVDCLRQAGHAVQAHIAGPVLPQAQDRFATCLASATPATWHGPLEGIDKQRFYRHLDFLVLPSHDEAEPLVILEALAEGTPVLASKVGCIPHALEDGEAVRCWPLDRFVAGAEAAIQACNVAIRPEARATARRWHATLHERAQQQRNAWLHALLREANHEGRAR